MADKKLTDNEIIKALENTEVKKIKKIKAIYPHIVVGGTADKPCYSIDWYNIETKTMHTGYSSYNLKFVQEWLKEYFEVVEDDIENLINRPKAEIERLKAEIKFSDYLEHETTNQIKAEAIKEFWGRLQGIAYQSTVEWSHGEHPMLIELDKAEDIYEEMVGEQNG